MFAFRMLLSCLFSWPFGVLEQFTSCYCLACVEELVPDDSKCVAGEGSLSQE